MRLFGKLSVIAMLAAAVWLAVGDSASARPRQYRHRRYYRSYSHSVKPTTPATPAPAPTQASPGGTSQHQSVNPGVAQAPQRQVYRSYSYQPGNSRGLSRRERDVRTIFNADRKIRENYGIDE